MCKISKNAKNRIYAYYKNDNSAGITREQINRMYSEEYDYQTAYKIDNYAYDRSFDAVARLL